MITAASIANSEAKIRALKVEWNSRACKSHLLPFTKATFPKFNPTWFHKSYYSKLNDFVDGKIKKLMVFVPPQHGKSEGSTRRAPAFILGRNPDLKIAIVCYNSTKARKFNREVQRIIDEPVYKELFPNTKLSNGNDGYTRTNDEFEVVGHNGGLRSVGVGGPLTGETVDILIMDDLYKDAMAAWSPTIRSNVQEWYDTVGESRLHNDSQQLLVFTRWHPEDLAGRLIKTEGKDWEIVVYPAIKLGPPNDYDPREEGEALYPEKHNLEKLQKVRDRNPHVFGSLYQQDPQPKEGLLYSGFKTYTEIPYSAKKMRKAYVDTADQGKDYLCSIAYHETELYIYVLDVIYTQAGMETTEPLTARQLLNHGVELARVESNNGGRGFARNVEDQTRLAGNHKTEIGWFHQGENKIARIMTNSSSVTNLIIMPEGWDTRWPIFYNHVTNYSSRGGNEHDDAPDTLTGMVEFFGLDNIDSDTSVLSVFG